MLSTERCFSTVNVWTNLHDSMHNVSFSMNVYIHVYANLTSLVKVPISEMITSILFPDFRNCGGFIPKPTPPGVPVMITLPF